MNINFFEFKLKVIKFSEKVATSVCYFTISEIGMGDRFIKKIPAPRGK